MLNQQKLFSFMAIQSSFEIQHMFWFLSDFALDTAFQAFSLKLQ